MQCNVHTLVICSEYAPNTCHAFPDDKVPAIIECSMNYETYLQQNSSRIARHMHRALVVMVATRLVLTKVEIDIFGFTRFDFSAVALSTRTTKDPELHTH